TFTGFNLFNSKGIRNERHHNVTIKNCGLKDYIAGIYFLNVKDSKIINNNFTSNDYGVYVYADPFHNSSINITNNTITTGTGGSRGIYFYKGNNNTIVDNTFYVDSTAVGIYTYKGTNNLIKNNYFEPVLGVSSSDGINLGYSDNNIIINNTLVITRNSIFLRASSNNLIQDNNLTSIDESDPSDQCVYCLTGSNNNLFLRNDVGLLCSGGYWFSSSTNNTIQDTSIDVAGLGRSAVTSVIYSSVSLTNVTSISA
ncbi:unnamed protein product, partial [marine sediment metagenome]